MPAAKRTTPAPSVLRCAIYTRKSTEEGLSQDFNSLDAQREAAQDFIKSQQREGWKAVPAHFDDGGFTGANMDRPALGRLLDAVRAREIDCVVVYKVDRLSRSLLDFARIMGLFDEHQVSFVSVTQQFNTSSSLGRLTLHILSSFAEFERQLIGERTRDKMSAARRKGKWTGGCLVLGYDADPRGGRLIVNPTEAERVRELFRLFEEQGSIRATLAVVQRRGWKLKSWTRRDGSLRAGGRFSANTLRHLLTNVGYVGEVRHKGTIYPGEHAPIMDRDTWERVQALLRRYAPETMPRNKHLALLKGLLYCERCGAPMIPIRWGSKGRLYRYYVCRNARQKGVRVCPSRSLAAKDIEPAVLQRLAETAMAGASEVPADLAAQIEFVQRHIERVDYDGATGRVNVRFCEH
jgi:site-specific DNA recombinase